MRRLLFHIFLLNSISNLTCIADETTLFYPKQDNPFCMTPSGEDGECIKISECVPENRFLYITEDRRTTLLLRLVLDSRYGIVSHTIHIFGNMECFNNKNKVMNLDEFGSCPNIHLNRACKV